MRTAFVADGGPKTGLGHLGRCVAIAQAIERRSGAKPVFINDDAASRAWVKGKGFPAKAALDGKWDLVVLDSYLKTKSEIDALRKKAKALAVIDDFGKAPAAADWIINTAVRARKLYTAPQAKRFLLGPQFHPLRREFTENRATVRSRTQVRHVLVSLGGTGGPDVIAKIIGELVKVFKNGTIHALVGLYSKDLSNKWNGNVVFHRSPKNMKKILSQMDLVVSAGGQTLFELAYMGIPTLAIEIAPNQHQNIQGFVEAGAAFALGKSKDRNLQKRLRESFQRLLKSPSQRRAMALAGRKLVDGMGGQRLAEVLVP